LVFALACSGAHSHDATHQDGIEEEQAKAALEDVVYVGGTTDEALERLLDLPAKRVNSERLVFDSPGAGQLLSKATPVAVVFHKALARLDVPSRALQRRWFSNWAQFWSPISLAHAHGTPVNGPAYLLTFADAQKHSVLRVFTNERGYTPTLEQWQELAAKEQALSLTLLSAVFENDAIVEDGGPFVGAEVSFEIR
jgi:hypothetical protein